jgi:hypothetical protein
VLSAEQKKDIHELITLVLLMSSLQEAMTHRQRSGWRKENKRFRTSDSLHMNLRDLRATEAVSLDGISVQLVVLNSL